MRLIPADAYMENGLAALKYLDVRPAAERIYPPTFLTWKSGLVPPFTVKVPFPVIDGDFYGIA